MKIEIGNVNFHIQTQTVTTPSVITGGTLLVVNGAPIGVFKLEGNAQLYGHAPVMKMALEEMHRVAVYFATRPNLLQNLPTDQVEEVREAMLRTENVLAHVADIYRQIRLREDVEEASAPTMPMDVAKN